MVFFLWAAAVCCAGTALVMALAAFVHAIRVRPAAVRREGSVTLILPLKGHTPRLELLFGALARQGLRPRRLLVPIENLADPARRQVEALKDILPFPVEILCAGTAATRGHKCTNLIAAFRRIDPADDAVVMLDGDILPQDWWLSTLASPVLEGRWDLVTGYRWPSSLGAGRLSHGLTWFDRAFAILPKFQAFAFVWGGSLALSRTALARLDMVSILDRTLSDDLSIGTAARGAGLRVLTRRILLLPTIQDGSACRFMRRQMQITHIHRPGLFHAAMAVFLLDLVGWVSLLLLAATSVIAQAAIAGILASRLARWLLNLRLGVIIGAPEPRSGQIGQLIVAVLAPVGSLLALLLMLQALSGRLLVWRGITYRMDGPQSVRVVDRALDAEGLPAAGLPGVV